MRQGHRHYQDSKGVSSGVLPVIAGGVRMRCGHHCHCWDEGDGGRETVRVCCHVDVIVALLGCIAMSLL